MKPIYLMVLAAGLSSRFGRNKLVETIDGMPIVERVVRTGQGAGLKATMAVTGSDLTFSVSTWGLSIFNCGGRGDSNNPFLIIS